MTEDGFERTDDIVLSDLEIGDLVYFHGSNPHAFYTVKALEDDKVKIWCDRSGGTTGLVTEAENIGVIDRDSINHDTDEADYYPEDYRQKKMGYVIHEYLCHTLIIMRPAEMCCRLPKPGAMFQEISILSILNKLYPPIC